MFHRSALVLIVFLLACTKQMAIQPRYEPQGESQFFDDHRVEREPIPGTVSAASEDIEPDAVAVTRELLLRGQQRFNISCAPCHDRAGTGHGAIVQSGFKQPEALDSPTMRSLKLSALIEIIRDGRGTMAGYRGLISARDMIAISHYVRVLQTRSHVAFKDLSDDDKKTLESAR